MFRRAVSVVLQTIFFILVFAVGSFLPALTPVPMWRVNAGATHYFVLDGVVLALLIYLIILAVEAGMKRIRTAGALTTLSLVLAFALALAMKVPFMGRHAM